MGRRRVADVAVGLGTNLGDRLRHLRFGVRWLARSLDDLVLSPVFETLPRHLPGQPNFLNACCVGRTSLTARQLLATLKDAERLAGRTEAGPRYGPRVLDLDLLLYGETVIETPRLVVPHPRLRERAFVLVPLRKIAADWWVPGHGEVPGSTVRELADRVHADGVYETDLRIEES